MQFTIHLATTPEEYVAIYRLRYEIYIKEMHIFGNIADHDREQLIDAHDEGARLLYAKSADGEIAGTMRVNLGAEQDFSDEFLETYGIEQFLPYLDSSKMAILTRFMVRKAYRNTRLPLQLISKVAGMLIRERIELAFCDCQPHLINLYRRLGFRSYKVPVFNDPEFGIMVPLLFLMSDLAYLKALQSPMLPLLSHQNTTTTPSDGLLQLLENTPVKSIDPDGIEGNWNEIFSLLSQHSLAKVKFFDGLMEEEKSTIINSAINRGHLIECQAGDLVIKKGQPARTVYVVLSGSLEVKQDEQLIALVQAGEMVGELAFLLSARRTANVYAGPTGARVLSLDDSRLKQLIENPNRIAAVVLLNVCKALAYKLADRTARVHSTDTALLES